MHRFVTLAAVVVLAASSAGCAGGDRDNPSSIAGPSGVGASDARGGGGKGKPSGGGDGTSSLRLVMVTDYNANGLPNWSDQVTFDISTTATTQPNVSLTCSQNGVVVYGATAGFYDGYPWPWTRLMTLSSNSWQGGAASCVAKLYYFSGTTTVNLTSISFTASE